MYKMKKQKGITLVALIITIIILLILAVVSIRAVQGDGIIQHAKNARNDYQAAEGNERTILDDYLTQIEEGLNSETQSYEIAITDSNQIYALGRLLNSNNLTIASLTSYSGSEQEVADLSLFEIPEEYISNADKIAFLQTASYGLENDIAVTLQATSGTNCFIGIGGTNDPFKGKFYGNGKTITISGSTLNVNNNFAAGVGLFGVTDGATISNININLVEDILVNIVVRELNFGLLVGNAMSTQINKVTISMEGKNINVDLNTAYRNAVRVGGVTGYIQYCNISNCDVNLSNSTISLVNDYEGDTKQYFLGGLVGNTKWENNIENCNVSFIDTKIRI